jgi:hypothetical protein
LMTPASKSALIEQLKARHSSQQQKLQDLTIRVEQTRKDNRRLRNTILLLAAVAIAIPLAIFHNKIFPHAPVGTPAAPTLGKPVSKKPAAAAPAHVPVHKPLGREWTLLLSDGKSITLHKGSLISPRFIHPKAKPEDYPNGYAQLAEDNHALVLINDSMETWIVTTPPPGHSQKVVGGKEWPLAGEPVTITFPPGITGTLTPVAEAPTPDQP